MSAAGRMALSAAIGMAVAVASFAITALVNTALDRRKGAAVFSSMARGSLVRMLGAIAGVALAVRMGPPSITSAVLVFLAVYLGAQAALVARTRRTPAV